MSILKKILEEIEERLNMVENIPINEDDDFLDCEEYYETGRVQGRFEELLWCRNIIRFHIDEVAEDWISVEERLPEERMDCLVAVKYNGFMGMHGTWIKVGHIENDGEWWGDCMGGEVIAWKKLPEPYKPNKK